MKRGKKSFLLVVGLIGLMAMLIMTACGQKASTPSEPAKSPDKIYKWDFLIHVPATQIYGTYFIDMANAIKEKSNGRLDIVVRPPSELPYKGEDYLRVCGEGSVQMADATIGYIAGTSRIITIPTLPFFSSSVEQFTNAMEKMKPYAKSELEKFGCASLGWYLDPPQTFFGKGTPVKKIADLKGRKVRTYAPEQQVFLKKVGAVAVSMSASEVAAAAGRGVIDSLIASGFGVDGFKWDEFFNWSYYLNYNMSGAYILVNSAALAELPADLRTILEQTVAETTKKMQADIIAVEEKALSDLQTRGMTVFRPGSEVAAEGAAMMKDYWESWAKEGGPEIEKAFNEIRQIVGK